MSVILEHAKRLDASGYRGKWMANALLAKIREVTGLNAVTQGNFQLQLPYEAAFDVRTARKVAAGTPGSEKGIAGFVDDSNELVTALGLLAQTRTRDVAHALALLSPKGNPGWLKSRPHRLSDRPKVAALDEDPGYSTPQPLQVDTTSTTSTSQGSSSSSDGSSDSSSWDWQGWLDTAGQVIGAAGDIWKEIKQITGGGGQSQQPPAGSPPKPPAPQAPAGLSTNTILLVVAVVLLVRR